MTPHLSDLEIQQFINGTTPIERLEAIANHLDQCAECLNRVTLADPLHLAYASTRHPEVPQNLSANIIAAIDESQRTPWTELLVGGALLVAASFLMIATIEPIEAAAESLILLNSITRASEVVTAHLSTYALFGLAVVGAFVLASSIALQTGAVQRRIRT